MSRKAAVETVQVCRQCGAYFLAYAGMVNAGKAMYCSRECRRESRRAALATVPVVPINRAAGAT